MGPCLGSLKTHFLLWGCKDLSITATASSLLSAYLSEPLKSLHKAAGVGLLKH